MKMKFSLLVSGVLLIAALCGCQAGPGGPGSGATFEGGTEAGNPPASTPSEIGGTEAGNPPTGDHGATGSIDPREGGCSPDGKDKDGNPCTPLDVHSPQPIPQVFIKPNDPNGTPATPDNAITYINPDAARALINLDRVEPPVDRSVTIKISPNDTVQRALEPNPSQP